MTDQRWRDPARIISVFGLTMVVYAIIGTAANWSEIVDEFSRTDWALTPVALALAAMVYPAMAISLLGAADVRLAPTTTTKVMLAQSFPAHFTPANAGGLAVRTRYLQRCGSQLGTAASTLAITTLAAAVAQMFLAVAFAVWSRQQPTLRTFSTRDVEGVAVVVFVVALVGGVLVHSSWGRRTLRARLDDLRTAVGGYLREVAHDPRRLALLAGGALLTRAALAATFITTAQMAGITLGIGQIGLLYIAGISAAAAAPTPGGLGAVEAALMVALTGAGVESDRALTAILVYRLTTYWAPMLPGWLALRRLRVTGVI